MIAEDAVGLEWGFKASFRDYLARMRGSVEVIEPAEATGDSFFFPYVGRKRVESSLVLRFGGEVGFTGHGGLLRLRLAQPMLVFDQTTVGVAVKHPQDESAFVVIARLTPGSSAGPIQATLSQAGSNILMGTYSEGTELDPIRLRLPKRLKHRG
ncbi:Htaa protein [Variovorax sp. HW608]|uniref:HtaA domain-containing protein n=1 Tax=Variovorax sp. HW608 TaxID=1034889 RepID=UPI00081F9EF4|nr:HtaA domain-containing protein [Variovorax sp. HW608]SCK42716.1 Htaa protein [Variovorax sp. HW608]